MNFVDPDGKAFETALDIISVVSGVKNLIQNIQAGNVKDAIHDGAGVVVDVVAAAVPLLPGGVGVVRTGVKAVNTIDNAADATKTARSGELADAVKTMGDMSETSKVTHGNSRMSTKSQHAYDIIDSETGRSKYESVITHTEPEGVGARDRILDYEKRRADHLRQHNQLDKNRHIRP